MKINNLFHKKWFQVLLYIFLVILIGNIYQKAAGWFVIASTLGLVVYNFFTNERFKKRKLIFKIGVGFLFFIMLFMGIGLSNPSAPGQQPNEKVTAQKSSNQSNPEQKKTEEVAAVKNDEPAAAKTEETKPAENTGANESTSVNGQLKVHFIDVGQADCILVQQDSSNMLIDAGNNGDAQTIKNYLDRQGVKSLDVVVGTHAHEDHIGSMDYIINSLKVGKVYFPKQTATTKTFQDFVEAVKNNGLQLTAPVVGSTFKIGDATAEILAPNGTGYEDANDYSIVIKLTYGNTSFLLTGDAEAVSESQMLAKGLDLSATVLKVGHHGSRTSTSQSFLNKVNPKFAVISVGKGNTYGHPTQEVMDRLKAKNIPVYRTDENGTVVAVSNGSSVSFNVSPGSYNGIKSSSSSSTSTSSTTTASSSSQTTTKPTATPATTSSGEKQYVDAKGNGLIKGNASSKIYHLPGGAYYDRTIAEVWFKTESEAQAAGYRRSSR